MLLRDIIIPYKSSVIFESLSKEDYAKIAPHLGQVKCVTADAKTDRGYLTRLQRTY